MCWPIEPVRMGLEKYLRGFILLAYKHLFELSANEV
jgi:hypothetical protein